jgi:hypothetical protein
MKWILPKQTHCKVPGLLLGRDEMAGLVARPRERGVSLMVFHFSLLPPLLPPLLDLYGL